MLSEQPGHLRLPIAVACVYGCVVASTKHLEGRHINHDQSPEFRDPTHLRHRHPVVDASDVQDIDRRDHVERVVTERQRHRRSAHETAETPLSRHSHGLHGEIEARHTTDSILAHELSQLPTGSAAGIEKREVAALCVPTNGVSG